MSHHHKTMEIGGWTLLIAAIAFLLYLLFHKDGQAALTGGTVVSSNIIAGLQVTPTGPPAITPNDPTAQSSYMDGEGTIWTWNPVGKQWTVSGASGTSQARFRGALSFLNSVV